MGKRIVIQPDGKFCEFSEVVDDITWYDMDEQEVIMLYYQEALKEAGRLAGRKIKAAKENPGRWKECLDIMRINHGQAKVDTWLKECSL